MNVRLAVAMVLGMAACSGDGAADPVPLVVSRAASYAWTETPVVYAQGLRHADWNAPSPEAMDLVGLLWLPEAPGPRPALLIIHGGGFLGGSHTQPELIDYAEFFAARGWVVLSIDYRLYPDFPTLPPAWVTAVHAADRPELAKALGCTTYGATRDAKAAVRYLQARAPELGLDPTRIAVMGGSAGAFLAVALGVSEPSDFRDELSLADDPTLATTHLEQDGRVVAVLDHWGGPDVLEAHAMTYGGSLWDPDDAPVQIVHGTADEIVPFAGAEVLRDACAAQGIPCTFHPIEGAGHGPWTSPVGGRPLTELGFEFLAAHQGVVVED